MELLTIELRPQIQSGYVYILLQPNISMDNVKITVDNNSMILKIGDHQLLVNFPLINVISSSFQIIDQWVIVRVQLSQSNLSHQNEVINSIETKAIEALKINIDLPPANENLNIFCNFCKNTLLDNTEFKRVLSLPSEECEPSEWFCCSHSDVDYKNILCPRTNDCFYGSHYYVLNKNIFGSELTINDKDVACNKCSSVLGIVKDENSFKIWNNSLQYSSHSFEENKKSPFDDFKLAIKEFIKNGGIFREIKFFALEKSEKLTLSVKIMDTNLSLLTKKSINDNNEVTLEQKQVMKVLYKISEDVSTHPQNDSNFSICQISIVSINAATKHLIASSQQLPPIYRSTDTYFIGYIY
ncbi:uncharacterized protein LOC130672761 [Microplitis mediator]|uniref:uncharacterized protein LOC130672761 n=1 Tax=Microplitis mediator TaxID=375433 RepID=UPI0025569BD1|nr:uncharacterized protein LOC130672761 [Microplitis mediator]